MNNITQIFSKRGNIIVNYFRLSTYIILFPTKTQVGNYKHLYKNININLKKHHDREHVFILILLMQLFNF